MPVPVAYSESLFADYLASVLGDLAGTLGWDAGSVQIQEALVDTLLDMGVSTIASVTDMRGLRALGRRSIWRAVVQATAGDYSMTDNGQKLERQQVNDQAHKFLESAEAECRALGADSTYAVSVISINRPHDPYVVLEPSARTLP